MTTIFKKFATGTAALALMTTVFAGSTLAAENIDGTSDANAEIKGSIFSILNVATTPFKDEGNAVITLDGTVQEVNADMGFDIVDARGTGSGWTVSIEATPFTQAEGKHPLNDNALTFGAPTSINADTGASEINSITIGAELSNTKLLTAAPAGGMGTYTLSQIPMELTLLPKEVYEGTYTSTVNVTLTTTP